MLQDCYSKKTDSKLDDQNASGYDMESYGAYKQVDWRSAVDVRAQKILQEPTYHDGSRYHVGMLGADDQINLQKNYSAFSSVRTPSWERPEFKRTVFNDHP